jgi:hypothetical protein
MRARNFRLLIVWTLWMGAGQLAAWGFGGAASRTTPERTARPAVSFDLYQNYMIIVRGSAGPVKGLNFLLDTGATPSVLDPRVAGKLHLDVANEEIAVLGGSVHGGRATVPSLEVGPVRKESLPVLVEDLGFLRNVLPVQVDGIVGLDVLGQSAFVIDYAAREIRFGASAAMRDSVPLRMEGGLAYVDATVNHTAVHLLLDTGAPSLILFDQAATPVGGSKIAGPEPATKPKPVGGGDRKPVKVSNFALGEAQFGREPAFAVQNQRDAGHDFDGLMSPAALGITQVAVDLGRGTLAFAR